MKKAIMTYIDYVSNVSIKDDFEWIESENKQLKKTNNINYLGELLERWKSRGFEFIDVLKYAAKAKKVEHNTGQVSDFIDLTEKIIFDKKFALAGMNKELNREFTYVYLHMVKNLKPEYLLEAYAKFLNHYKGIDVVFMDISINLVASEPILSNALFDKKHPIRAKLISFLKQNKIDLIKYIGARKEIDYKLGGLKYIKIDSIIFAYFSGFIKQYSITKKELGDEEFKGYNGLKQFGKPLTTDLIENCVFLFKDREVTYLTNLIILNPRYSDKSLVKSGYLSYLKNVTASILQWDSPNLKYFKASIGDGIGIHLGTMIIHECKMNLSIPITIGDCTSENCDIEKLSDFIFQEHDLYYPRDISLDVFCDERFIIKLEDYIETTEAKKIEGIVNEALTKLMNIYPSNKTILLKYLTPYTSDYCGFEKSTNRVYLWAILNGIITIEKAKFTDSIKDELIWSIYKQFITKLDNNYEVVIRELVYHASKKIEEPDIPWWKKENNFSFLLNLLSNESAHLEKSDLLKIEAIFIEASRYETFLDSVILNKEYRKILGMSEQKLKDLFLYLVDIHEENYILNLKKMFVNLDIYEKIKIIDDLTSKLYSCRLCYDFEGFLLLLEKHQDILTEKEIEKFKLRFMLKIISNIESNFVNKVNLLIGHNYISTNTAQKWLAIILKKGALE